MTKRHSLLLFIIIIFSVNSFSQTKYWVFLTDKDGCTFNPFQYFDSKAISRRLKHNIPIDDITDYPLNKDYVNIVRENSDSILGLSRWFNAIAVVANKNQIENLHELYFVKTIEEMHVNTFCAKYKKFNSKLTEYEKDLLNKQTARMQGSSFWKNNITGKGVRIAIFDAGFPTVDTSPVFEEIRNEHRIIKTFDFKKKKEFVYSYNMHGLAVMSCIGGKINGKNIGLATGAEFLLARTEFGREPIAEEEYWLQAVEWADKNGADIINSSLGYTVPRYFQKQMDGKKTLVSRAAKMASDKGILVVNAMGNDGDGSWKVVGAPADVDEVLSIGGIDPNTNIQIDFSSFGPTADGRMKPNVCASGEALVASPKGGVSVSFGTSFSSPLIAGFSACALQTDTSQTNMELKRHIEQSGNLYPYFDYAHGFGIPKASFFTDKKAIKIKEYFNIETYSDSLIINFNADIDSVFSNENYFFYHFRYENEPIAEYVVVEMTTNKLTIHYDYPLKPIIFMAHFKGYTREIEIK